MAGIFEYARRRFDRNCHAPYDNVARAWAVALGIDASEACARRNVDAEPDEDAELRRCRTQRYGVRL